MASSILFRSADVSLLLIDIPRSIEQAQGDTISRIVSAEPLQHPYPSLEPKSSKAKANAQLASLDDLLLQRKLEFALHDVVESYSGPFCLPRIYGQGPPLIHESQAPKKRKIDPDTSRPLMNNHGFYVQTRYLDAETREDAPTPCLDQRKSGSEGVDACLKGLKSSCLEMEERPKAQQDVGCHRNFWADWEGSLITPEQEDVSMPSSLNKSAFEVKNESGNVSGSSWTGDMRGGPKGLGASDAHNHSNPRTTWSKTKGERLSSQSEHKIIKQGQYDAFELRNCSKPSWSDIAREFGTFEPMGVSVLPSAADVVGSRVLEARQDQTYKPRYWFAETGKRWKQKCPQSEEQESQLLDDEGSFIYSNPSPMPTNIQILSSPSYRNARIPPGSTVLHGDIASTLPAFTHWAPKFDLVILDPPWPNRSAKRSKHYGISYDMQDIRTLLTSIPLEDHLTVTGIVCVWVTNKSSCREMVLGEGGLFEQWGVQMVEEWIWLKTTASGEPICALDSTWRKPFEVMLLGCRGVREAELKRRVLVGVPDLHSRKPNLKEAFEATRLLGNHESARGERECLEIFARNATAGWWAWGNEVLKFQMEACWVDPSALQQDTVDIDTPRVRDT